MVANSSFFHAELRAVFVCKELADMQTYWT